MTDGENHYQPFNFRMFAQTYCMCAYVMAPVFTPSQTSVYIVFACFLQPGFQIKKELFKDCRADEYDTRICIYT